MYSNQTNSYELNEKTTLSIIIPTYNESRNIVKLIETIQHNIPDYISAEILVVDDDSPDGTGKIVSDYISDKKIQSQYNIEQFKKSGPFVKVIRRENRNGLMPAILDGIKSSHGENILVMDADFSHPPEIIPAMVKELLIDQDYDLVIASRYVEGGSITGWPFKRRILSSCATKIAQFGLKIKNVQDPMSGFFLFRRNVIENMTFDTAGYKILLEMLVKRKRIRIKEIPYDFVDRKFGKSKLDTGVMIDYLRAVWKLYRYGRRTDRVAHLEERRKSVLFFSKAARFYTVGATGLLINYLVSFMLSNGILSNFFYIHATAIGIACSIISNFFLNKFWTFEDRNFLVKRILKQFSLYAGFSTFGATLQLSLLYFFVQYYSIQYALALVFAVAIASVGNFLLNKRWTFKEIIWG